jgi:peptide-methionine (S)-S-oxide reductase
MSEANIAQPSSAQLGKSGAWNKPIVTRIENFGFHAAEEYHQDFIRKNPQNSYIRTWDLPKIAALKRLFPKLYR